MNYLIKFFLASKSLFKRNYIQIKKMATSGYQLLLLDKIPRKRKPRKVWFNAGLQKRTTFGVHNTIIFKLHLQDRYRYRKYLRVNCEMFKIRSSIKNNLSEFSLL